MKTTKYLIIGQGLAGALLGAKLLEREAEFLIMDAFSPHAASQVAGGAFIPIVFRTLKKAEMIDEYLPALFNTYDSLEKLTGKKFLHMIPSLKLFNRDDIHKWQAAKKSTAGEFIKDLHSQVDISGVKPGFCGAVIEPSGWVDTKLLTAGMGEWFLKNNLLIQEKLDYNRIEFKKDGMIVNGRIKAEKIIFCEGAGAFHNPWFGNAGFSLNKGEILEIEVPGLNDDYIIRGDVFVMPLGNNRFRVGATYDQNNIDHYPTEAGKQQLLQKLDAILSLPFKVVSHHAGIRPSIKDRKPVMGAHPHFPQLFIFNGLGSKGVLYGPYRAIEMADFLLHGKALPAMVDVNRYF
ncbi:MAG: FAD-binding oxidoreductase [Bacteroidales bacterium]|nr:FAD-binding oxidoreductase [Bacteroidales bacterium]